MTPEISTTSAAILGLLAVQPGTPYDLARRMERNHRFIWPRAESKLYEEVKRLAAAGLADASHGATGRRPRTVYSITRAGRAALRAWSRRPSELPSFSSEALVKLAYADFGDVEGALAQIRELGEHASRCVALGGDLGRMYRDGDVELPERAHTNVLVWLFLAHHFAAMKRWAALAERIVEQWDGTTGSPPNDAVTRRAFVEGLAMLDEVADDGR